MKPSKEEVLSRLVRSASERWGDKECEELKPTLAMIAEAINFVDGFDMAPEDEPAQHIDLSKMAKSEKATGA